MLTSGGCDEKGKRRSLWRQAPALEPAFARLGTFRQLRVNIELDLCLSSSFVELHTEADNSGDDDLLAVPTNLSQC